MGRFSIGRRPWGSLALAVGLLAVAPAAASAAGSVTISQAYVGGGTAGAAYTNDYVELFNGTDTAFDISGWSIQRTSANGTTWSTTPFGSGLIIDPGQYFLVQEFSHGPNGNPLPTPDVTGTTNMGATGKVALVASSVALSGSCPTGGTVVDFVGYGSGVDCFEGSGPTPALSNSTAALRGGEGCDDSDDNATDFTAGSPNPRNTASPTHTCVQTLTVDLAGSGSGHVTGTTAPATARRPTRGVAVWRSRRPLTAARRSRDGPAADARAPGTAV